MIAKGPAVVIILASLAWTSGCHGLPGKPTEADRWVAPSEVADFNQLYRQNCSGCHGADGRLGPARSLNDPLYLSLASPDDLRKAIGHGVPATAMPAFGQRTGGGLTDAQVDLIVESMRSRWGRTSESTDATLPPYSLQAALTSGTGAGDQGRGAAVYGAYCAQCHGVDGTGGPKGGSIVDPNFLRLVSDQSLRTTVIVGRQDIGKPDWRANLPGRPMSPGEISDVVAWITAHRPKAQINEAGPSSN